MHGVRASPAALDSPVYHYVVTHTPSGPITATSDLLPFPSRFSFHCLDTVSFFGGLEAVLGKPLSDADDKFQGLITQHLVTFAKTGELTSCPAEGGGAGGAELWRVSIGPRSRAQPVFAATLLKCSGPGV